MSIAFELNGQSFAAINGGPAFKCNEAVSFLTWCDTQTEIDALWNKLIEGGQPQQCGLLKDKFGVVWQVNYSKLTEMLTSSDDGAASRAMQAMMQMKKIIQHLKDACAGR
jgi:predicted 3-demethylubiquinone-9 3-methyltransferase (glyoxalase superfamily)